VEFSIKQVAPESMKSGCVVVGVHDGGKLSKAAQALDKAAKHVLSDVIAHGDMNGESATTLLLHKVPGIAAQRVLLVGLGKSSELDNRGTELEFVIMVIAVSCVKLLSAHNSTQHTSRKHKV
jgi:aminopeptidase A. Metallo peptidase. MEROPS family M17